MTEPDVTLLLRKARTGDRSAQDALAPLVYDELKGRAEALMRRERKAQSIQATVLVSDAFMKLVDVDNIDWESRNHFFALASNVMRRVLVDHARARGRQKRGGDAPKVEFEDALMVSIDSDDHVLRVDEALQRLAEVDERQAKIVTLRFFGGLGRQEVADAVGMSKRSVEREWSLIKAWLRRELSA